MMNSSTLLCSLLLSSVFILCSALDLETSLEDGAKIVETLKGSYTEEQLQILSTLGEWGSMTTIAIGRAAFILIDESVDIKEDEVEMGLKLKLDEMNNAITQLESEFTVGELSLKVQNHLINLKVIQQNLQKFNEQIDKLINSPNDENKEMVKEAFFEFYEKEFINTSENIYLTLAQNSKAFHAVSDFHKKDKKKTFQYMKVTTVLLLKSIAVDLTFQLLKNGKIIDGEETEEVEEILEASNNLWSERLSLLGGTINTMSTYLTNIWQTQYKEDVRILLSVRELTLDLDAKRIHSYLEEKYFWRRCYVVVIQKQWPTWWYQGRNFDINTCNGLEKLEVGDRHVFIKCVDSVENFESDLALSYLRKVEENPLSKVDFLPHKATLLNEKMGVKCSSFPMFGSVRDYGYHDEIAIYGNHVTKTVPVYINGFFESFYKAFIMV